MGACQSESEQPVAFSADGDLDPVTGKPKSTSTSPTTSPRQGVPQERGGLQERTASQHSLARISLPPKGGNNTYFPVGPFDKLNYDPFEVAAFNEADLMRIELKFFQHVRHNLDRDYTLIVDKSGSMAGGGRWNQAKDAVGFLAPHITKNDQDGVTVIFFSSKPFKKYVNVKEKTQVIQLFMNENPGGGTDLAGVLEQVLEFHFSQPPPIKHETILVITDGEPNDKQAVMNVIVQYTNKMQKDEEISISFIQVGDDPLAGHFLRSLDNDLKSKGAKFDIVDKLSHTEMKGMTFTDLIAKSIND
eukprot:gnl/Hemi2/7368_TR2509_c0_g1_i1.p1 gnl/Hemi2/7368_TR2509_c0_g1~~gnl/Hemi2/7368_TR2509_c0_g1_i1.p1  ORF type:complete len:303 (-),score=59.72 gnl/Hemi2/7368_TR2509_c0_g1_i1:88-996(-)